MRLRGQVAIPFRSESFATLPRYVSTGPVVVRLAAEAIKRARERALEARLLSSQTRNLR